MKIAVLPGDGIGSEIMHEALRVLDALALDGLELTQCDVGGIGYKKHGHPLPPATLEATKKADAVLFGAHWPLSEIVKLDATVDRRVLRQQRDRLGALGYKFAPLSQDWHLAKA